MCFSCANCCFPLFFYGNPAAVAPEGTPGAKPGACRRAPSLSAVGVEPSLHRSEPAGYCVCDVVSRLGVVCVMSSAGPCASPWHCVCDVVSRSVREPLALLNANVLLPGILTRSSTSSTRRTPHRRSRASPAVPVQCTGTQCQGTRSGRTNSPRSSCATRTTRAVHATPAHPSPYCWASRRRRSL